MRWFGVLLIVVAGVGMGLHLSRRLFRRADWLAGVVSMLDALEDRLVYSSAPLSVLWGMLTANSRTAGLSLVQEVAEGLQRELPFDEAFVEAVDAKAAAGLLLPPEQEALRLLAASIGRSGMQLQREHIHRCCDALKRAQQNAVSHAAVQAPIYRVAGIAGGVSVALLLL